MIACMQISRFAVPLAATLLATMSLGGCGKPSVALSNVRLSDIGPQRIDLLMEFNVENPNPVDLDLSQMRYSLSAAGSELAGGTLDRRASVPAGGSGSVTLPVSLPYAALVPLWEARASGEALPYELLAEFDLAKYGVPVKVPLRHRGSIPPLRAPSLRLRDVRLAGVDRIEVLVDVSNPNTFQLPLESLAGRLVYGGETLVEIAGASIPTIPAGETKTITLPVRLSPAGLKKVAAAVMTGSGSTSRIAFDGGVKPAMPSEVREMLLGGKGR